MASMKKEPIEMNPLLADTFNSMVGIYASKSNEPRKVTANAAQNICCTERQINYINKLNQGMHKISHPGRH